MNETAKDCSSGEMLLKILTAEKERLAKIVLEEGSTSRKSSGFQSAGALKSDVETLSNDNSAGKSTLSLIQVGSYCEDFSVGSRSCNFYFCHVHSCSMVGFFEPLSGSF